MARTRRNFRHYHNRTRKIGGWGKSKEEKAAAAKLKKEKAEAAAEAKKLNLWSIVRNYTSWRNSFDNNEILLNTINKAIKNACT